MVHTLPQICVWWYPVGSFKLATWEYLHHGYWQTLQIGAFSSPRDLDGIQLPAHRCCQPCSSLSLCMTGFLQSINLSSCINSSERHCYLQLLPPSVAFWSIICSSFWALMSPSNYPAHILCAPVGGSLSSIETSCYLIHCSLPSI